MSTRRRAATSRHPRVIVEIKGKEEERLYHELQMELIKHRMTLRDLFVPLMAECVERLQRRALTPGKRTVLKRIGGMKNGDQD